MRILVLILLLVVSALGRTPKSNQEKQLLFEKYPQLNAPERSDCGRSLSHFFINVLEYPQSQMVYNSMHSISDLGNPTACEYRLENLATYAVFNFNFTHVPATLRWGFCLPKACSQEHLQKGNANLYSVNSNRIHIELVDQLKEAPADPIVTTKWVVPKEEMAA